MSDRCEYHYQACQCREHKVAVLTKAALDAATNLDDLQTIAPLDDEERESIRQVVERVYHACEALGVVIGAEEAESSIQHEEAVHL